MSIVTRAARAAVLSREPRLAGLFEGERGLHEACPRGAGDCPLVSRRRFLLLFGAACAAAGPMGPSPLAPASARADAGRDRRVDAGLRPNAAGGYWDRRGEHAHADLLAFVVAHPEAFALPTFRPSDMSHVTSGVQADRMGRPHNGDDYGMSDRPLAAFFRARLSVCWQPQRRTAEGGVVPGGGWVYTLQYAPGAAFARANPDDPLARGRFVAQYLHCAAPRGLYGDILRERGYDPVTRRGLPSRPPGIFLKMVEPGEVFGESSNTGTHMGVTGKHLDLRCSFVDAGGQRRYTDTKMFVARLLARPAAFNRRQHFLLDYRVGHQLTWERVETVFRELAQAALPRSFAKLAESPFLAQLEGGRDFARRCAEKYGVRPQGTVRAPAAGGSGDAHGSPGMEP